MYFAFAALPGLCLLAVENAGPAWAWARRGGLAKRLAAGLAAALAAAGLATGCFAWAGMTAEGAALLADRPAAVAGQDWDLPLTAGEEAAMEELAALLPADAWFATNRIHTGRALEGLSNVYTGLSGRTCWFCLLYTSSPATPSSPCPARACTPTASPWCARCSAWTRPARPPGWMPIPQRWACLLYTSRCV